MASIFLVQNQNKPNTNLYYQPSNTIAVCQILTNSPQIQSSNLSQRRFLPQIHTNTSNINQYGMGINYKYNAYTIQPQSQCQLQSSLINHCTTTLNTPVPVSVSAMHSNPNHYYFKHDDRNTPSMMNNINIVNPPSPPSVSSRLPLRTHCKHNSINDINCQLLQYQHVIPEQPYLYVSISV